MAIPPSRAPALLGSALAFAPGGLRRGVELPVVPAPTPAEQTSFVVASDAQPFTVGANQTVTVTFPGIPKRSTGSLLQQQPARIALANSDTLHFAVTLQQVTGPVPSVKPQVVDGRGVRIGAVVLPGNNVYEQFQVVITGGAQTASGVVSGTLTLMRA